MMEVKQDPLIGRTIVGKYRIEAKIGQGGMGSVYRARNIVTGKVVAIKVLLEDLAAYPSFVERFLHEARAAAYLTHPHAINIMDCGRDGEAVYLLMEYIEGRTLTELTRQEGPLSPQRAARILTQVCSALADAHSQSIVHRDLKPDNIILQQVAGEKDYVKVLDFGIAKVLDEQKRGNLPASRSVFVGTPEYASPEQCNSKSPTRLSDIYSLGVILYEMLTGHTPFEGDPMEVMMKHVSAEPPPLKTYRPDLSPEMEAVVMRALKKNPEERQPSVLQLAQEFEDAVRLSYGRKTQSVERSETEIFEQRQTQAQIRAMPTHAAARPAETQAQSRARRSWFSVASVLSGFAVIALATGAVSGYRFYRWYETAPSLPSPPAVRLEPVPRLVFDPVAAALKLYDEGNRESAVQELRSLIAQSEFNNPEAHNLLGFIYLDQGELVGAISEFKLALDQAEGAFAEAHLNLGQALLEQGDEDNAAKEFRSAIEQSGGKLIRAYVALGRLYLSQGKSEEAEKAFSAAIRLARDDAEDVLAVGKALLSRRQYELAVRELRRAIGLKDGFFPEAYLYLGITLLESGDFGNATEVLNTAVSQRAGNYPAARYALGMALYRQNDYQQALGELKTAIRLRGGFYPQAEWALGNVLADLAVGDYDEAEKELLSAIRNRNERFPQAQESLGRLYLFRLGRLEDARKALMAAGTKDSRELLEQAKDALVVQARAGTAQRVIRSELKSDSKLSFDFTFTPQVGRLGSSTADSQGGTDHPSVVVFKVGDSGMGVKIEREGDKPGLSIRTFRVNASREEPLDQAPFDSGLMENSVATVSVLVERNSIVFTLDGSEIARVRNFANSSLVATLRGGRAVLFNFREKAN